MVMDMLQKCRKRRAISLDKIIPIWAYLRCEAIAQIGLLHPATKPLRGFGSAGVLEVVEDRRGSTYRAVYTVRFVQAVYLLHCFQKKSKHGIQPPKREMDLIHERLREAEAQAKGFRA
jgi:phage-related protein